jgi:hypothetical protein
MDDLIVRVGNFQKHKGKKNSKAELRTCNPENRYMDRIIFKALGSE